MNFIIKHKLTLIRVVAGSIAGYLYCHFIGCASGTCAITSKPLNSNLYGALMGGLLLGVRFMGAAAVKESDLVIVLDATGRLSLHEAGSMIGAGSIEAEGWILSIGVIPADSVKRSVPS